MPSVLTIYQTEVDWLALVNTTVGNITLAFDHQPNEAEVLANAAPFEAPSESPYESPYEIETEGGGVV